MIQIVFYLLMTVWLFTEVFYRQRLASTSDDKKGKDKSTLNLLWTVIIISVSLSIFVSFVHFDTIDLSITKHSLIVIIGLIFIFLGIVARVFIIRALGKYFTVDVTIRENHKIKKDGFYSVLRHPSYAASMLTFLGLGLYLNNWIALIIALVPTFLAFSYRIDVEEKTLIEEFGQEYLDYKKHTKSIIPFIY